jgi:hypothetical protein
VGGTADVRAEGEYLSMGPTEQTTFFQVARSAGEGGPIGTARAASVPQVFQGYRPVGPTQCQQLDQEETLPASSGQGVPDRTGGRQAKAVSAAVRARNPPQHDAPFGYFPATLAAEALRNA